MSNTAYIEITKFVPLSRDGTESEPTYGLRVFDDHESTYANTFEKDDLVGKSNQEILSLAAGLDERAAEIVRFAREETGSIEICGETVSFDEPDPTAPGI